MVAVPAGSGPGREHRSGRAGARRIGRVIDPATDIGHVHLKVADLDRSLAFYEGLLGFEVQTRMDWGVFLSAGGYHHHLALNTYYSEGAGPAPRESAGLHHFAIRYPTREALRQAARTLIDAGIPVWQAGDH